MTNDNVHRLPRIGIGEAMRLYGLTARAIRFYEEKGLIQPRRDRRNVRIFEEVDRVRLSWIAQLRRAGMPLGDIAQVLQTEEAGRRRRERAIASLEELRQSLRKKVEQVEAGLAQLS